MLKNSSNGYWSKDSVAILMLKKRKTISVLKNIKVNNRNCWFSHSVSITFDDYFFNFSKSF